MLPLGLGRAGTGRLVFSGYWLSAGASVSHYLGFSMWFKCSHNTVAELQGQASRERKKKSQIEAVLLSNLKNHAASLSLHSAG